MGENAKLKKLKELYNLGFIDEEEFNRLLKQEFEDISREDTSSNKEIKQKDVIFKGEKQTEKKPKRNIIIIAIAAIVIFLSVFIIINSRTTKEVAGSKIENYVTILKTELKANTLYSPEDIIELKDSYKEKYTITITEVDNLGDSDRIEINEDKQTLQIYSNYWSREYGETTNTRSTLCFRLESDSGKALIIPVEYTDIDKDGIFEWQKQI